MGANIITESSIGVSQTNCSFDQLVSFQLAVLCFLFRDVLNRKTVRDRDHMKRLIASNPNVPLHIPLCMEVLDDRLGISNRGATFTGDTPTFNNCTVIKNGTGVL